MQYILGVAAMTGLKPGSGGAHQLAKPDQNPFWDSAKTRGEDGARSMSTWKKLLTRLR